MMDFCKFFFPLAAFAAVFMALGSLTHKVEQIDAQVQEVCVSMQHLLSNRPTPPIHSYAKALPICGEKR